MAALVPENESSWREDNSEDDQHEQQGGRSITDKKPTCFAQLDF